MSGKEKQLLDNYREMFKLFDCVHFNSSITEVVYKKQIPTLSGEVVAITHGDIRDCRRERAFADAKLELIFIGNDAPYKGLPLLIETLMELYQDGYTNWELNVWGTAGNSEVENIKYNGKFQSSELEKVFHTDGTLVVPSVCNETFSLITLEALSFGMPVLVSSTVGAKDIINEYDPWFVFTDKENLKEKLVEMMADKSRLRDFNNAIIHNEWHHSLEKHTKEIINLYERK